jgi:uncharacterized protein (DUF433 family)
LIRALCSGRRSGRGCEYRACDRFCDIIEFIVEVRSVTGKSLADRITIDADVCNGKPTIRHLRITVESVLDYLSAGESPDEILRQHPMLESEDISACLAFASRLMGRRYSVKETA